LSSVASHDAAVASPKLQCKKEKTPKLRRENELGMHCLPQLSHEPSNAKISYRCQRWGVAVQQNTALTLEIKKI
jgi:hypothetical protein